MSKSDNCFEFYSKTGYFLEGKSIEDLKEEFEVDLFYIESDCWNKGFPGHFCKFMLTIGNKTGKYYDFEMKSDTAIEQRSDKIVIEDSKQFKVERTMEYIKLYY